MSRRHLTVGQREMAILIRSPVSLLRLVVFGLEPPSIWDARRGHLQGGELKLGWGKDKGIQLIIRLKSMLFCGSAGHVSSFDEIYFEIPMTDLNGKKISICFSGFGNGSTALWLIFLWNLSLGNEGKAYDNFATVDKLPPSCMFYG